jgi:hypothetical protein
MVCPEFEYDGNPAADAILKDALIAFFRALKAANDSEKLDSARETRVWHSNFFQRLTPASCPYYAGHYRGEEFPCLRDYEVKIDFDPLVGEKATFVPISMFRLGEKLQVAAVLLDIEGHRHLAPLASREFIIKIVQMVTFFFVAFLTVHPYANGNGHMARLILALVLDRLGVRAPTFSIHPRPMEPSYLDAIYRYRRRDTKPLEMLLLRSLARQS